MDKEKSLLESLADTVLAAAESIVHPTDGTPMEMPLNESGYAITHLQPHLQTKPKPAAKRAAKKKKVARKPAKKSKSAAGGKARKAAARKTKKKAVTKVAKKKKAGKARR
jgi:hypothetical protein